ncbi:hypothetical protein ETH_00023680 [Eimeria tenella]|uniref:Uncharacterized protein n=1 Tax=Eimeria tenella TaxID=5802 RepID=U6KYG0_EIMTE|nr:hypothetical protein ETH_00023680 [Eimeria tenella]CDJ41943.1 hypothetical protein ETH_00023680 [Eimeria tenella]|eukprot:XP_013232693.1 hypothetical protein ETH_00023680 [Eimeria tenella]
MPKHPRMRHPPLCLHNVTANADNRGNSAAVQTSPTRRPDLLSARIGPPCEDQTQANQTLWPPYTKNHPTNPEKPARPHSRVLAIVFAILIAQNIGRVASANALLLSKMPHPLLHTLNQCMLSVKRTLLWHICDAVPSKGRITHPSLRSPSHNSTHLLQLNQCKVTCKPGSGNAAYQPHAMTPQKT